MTRSMKDLGDFSPRPGQHGSTTAPPKSPVSGRVKPADFTPQNQPLTRTDLGGFLERSCRARQAVPTPMTSSREMTFHEAPAARPTSGIRHLPPTPGFRRDGRFTVPFLALPASIPGERYSQDLGVRPEVQPPVGLVAVQNAVRLEDAVLIRAFFYTQELTVLPIPIDKG